MGIQTSMSEQEKILKRTIRSFVRREGRMSTIQKQAWEDLWPIYGIDFQENTIDLDKVFHRQTPRFLDIGFGMGESLLSFAAANPHCDYLGIEVYRTGIASLLHQCYALNLKNIRVICADAVDVLKNMITNQQFDGIMVFFPDPWPKQRHHKRRLLQENNLHLFADKLKPKGYLHIATDWKNYAEMIAKEVAKVQCLQAMSHEKAQAIIQQRANTKYERRGQRLGHDVFDLVYVIHRV